MPKWIRKLLIGTHRYLGLALSLMFLMWFLTGIGMMWSRGMPRLTPEMRLARMAPLDPDTLRLGPLEAAEVGGILTPRPETTLLTIMDRPAYRFSSRGTTTTVFADNGEILGELTLQEATAIAGRFLGLPPERIENLGVLTEPDQWTLTLGANLPMFRLGADDAAGTVVYVAPRLGEVVQLTTRRGRALAWVSVIPHFLYFRALRLDGELWTFLMTWGPGLGLIVALAGLVIGVVHFRPSRPFRFSRIPSYLPYRGWLRWHYAAGLVFGVVTVTFVWSGLLSMEPWSWTLRDSSLAGATRRAFPTGTGEIGEYPRPDAGGWRQVLGSGEVREVAFTRILGEPHLVARSAAEVPAAMGWPDGGHQPYFVQRSSDPARTVFSGTLETQDPLTTSEVVARISETITARVEAADWLDAYDTYYYSREGRSPLPVVRVKLADPDETWLYVDPGVAQVVGRINRVNRMERWLYAGLHTFDFPFLYERRPLWQAVIVTFCLGGAFISGVGFLLGLNRILRGFRRVPATGHA